MASKTRIIGKKPVPNSTLCDVQYCKGTRENDYTDKLYVIWRDEHDAKHLEIVENPPMDIYFTKPETKALAIIYVRLLYSNWT